MKHFTLTSRALLGLALMGAFAVAPTLTSRAQAQTQAEFPSRLTDNDDRFDDNDLRDNDGPRNRGDRDGHGRDERADGKFDGRGGKGRNFGGRDGKSRELGGRGDRGRNRPRPGRNFEGRDGDRGNRPSRLDERGPVIAPKFVGVVTKVKSEREFDVRIDNKTYNVYLSAPSEPVRVGQTVSLDGERVGNNDIRSATKVQPRRR